MSELIATAIEGGGSVASFGSGESGGRLQARHGRATGAARRANASTSEVRAQRSVINRATGISRAQRRRLLQEIDDNRNARGNIRRSVLSDIADSLRELQG